MQHANGSHRRGAGLWPQACLLVGLLGVTPAWGAEDLSKLPGYVDFESLNLMNGRMSNLEINLEGPLLTLVSEAVKDEDSEFSQLLSMLKSIRVQSYDLEEVPDTGPLLDQADHIAETLRAEGWRVIVRVREKEERVHVLLKEVEETIAGMMLVVVEPDELILVNIVGTFDPAQLGRLGRSLNIDPLEELGELTEGRNRSSDDKADDKAEDSGDESEENDS